MILGVDHIALSGIELEREGLLLEKFGFTRRFHHMKLPNVRGKDALLDSYQPLHDIGVYDPPSGTAIEVTVHGATRSIGTHFGFVPIIKTSSAPEASTPQIRSVDGLVESVRKAFEVEARLSDLGAFDTPIVVVENGQGVSRPDLLGAVHLVKDPVASSQFFQSGLSAQPCSSGWSAGRKWELVKFNGPVAKWRMHLLLVEAGEAAPLQLDNAGWPALAVLTSDMDADMIRAKNAGCAPLFRNELQVNQRPIEFSMLRGPGGELLELLYFPRRRP